MTNNDKITGVWMCINCGMLERKEREASTLPQCQQHQTVFVRTMSDAVHLYAGVVTKSPLEQSVFTYTEAVDKFSSIMNNPPSYSDRGAWPDYIQSMEDAEVDSKRAYNQLIITARAFTELHKTIKSGK